MSTTRKASPFTCIQEGFFTSAEFNASTHEVLVRHSHMRSREYGIDPNAKFAPDSSALTPEQLQDRIAKSKTFLDIVTTQMVNLYRVLEGSGFCMAVTDNEGYILHVMGDQQQLERYELVNCMPGYRWSEKDVGTSAISMALHYGIPVQISGAEVYCARGHGNTNSAAPVYDHHGVLQGVITLTGHADLVHTHTLGMVILSARGVRWQLSERAKSHELAVRNQYMAALLESDHRGVIALDKHGHVVQLNRKARALLQLEESAVDRDIDSLLRTKLNWANFLGKGKGFTERELTFAAGGGDQTVISTLDPITLPDGTTAGGVLILIERGRMLKLVNEMAGSQARFTFDSIIGTSESITEAKKLAQAAARGNASVLLAGETGTGKELFAQAIHNASSRRDNPFVVINCGAIPRELLESELFGYAEGAFTGALKGGRPGKFELADGGTLFLDEIGDMPLDMQVKILRALQSGEIHRVGGHKPIAVDLRIIVATHVNLDKAIAQGNFRRDLYYRISTLRIDIPALRERGSDVLLLADTFLRRNRTLLEKSNLEFAPESLQILRQYGWPGNIRQLENSVERAVNIVESGTIAPQDLGITVDTEPAVTCQADDAMLKDVERELILTQMDKHDGNISKVARTLGVSRPTLYRKLKQYGLDTKRA